MRIITKILFLLTMTVVFLSCEKKTEISGKISGAYKALNFWSYQRAYPQSAIPDVGHYKAFEYSQKLKKSTAVEAMDGWRAIGPHNMGGRTLAVAFNPQNPNTIYAGSASGGLWRSYSAGKGAQAWQYISTGFPVLGVSSIAIAPNDSNTIYIGTGEVYSYQGVGTGAAYRSTRGTYGIGVLKSIDGGLTWEKSLDWSYNQKRGIWAIKLNPANPKTVWAATTEGTYRSYDAGISWEKVHDVIMAMDLVINFADSNKIIVTCGNFKSQGHGIYLTEDGGDSWNKTTAGLPETFGGKALLSTTPEFPDIVFASIGNGFDFDDGHSWLCISSDAGKTWGVVSEQDYSKWQGWFAHDVAVDPQNFANVLAVGIDAWKSELGGSGLVQKTVWSKWYKGQLLPGQPEGPPDFSHADHHDVIYHPTDPDIIYMGTDGGVFRSLDGGETFEACNGGYQTTQFYNGFSNSQQDSLLAIGGLQDNGTIVYRGTTAWDRIVIGGDGCWAGIDFTNDNVMYGSSQNLNVSRSTNRGRSFGRLSIPGSNRFTSFVAPFVVSISNPSVLYAGRDIVYKSTTRGASWSATNSGQPLDGNPVMSMAISYLDEDVVYAATAPYGGIRSGIFRTLDGGNSWANITLNLPDRFPTDVVVDPNNDKNVYVTFSGFGTSHLFKSTNGGENWIDISSGLPDVPTNAVIVDPENPQFIYAGNDLGVFSSTDGGTTWLPFSDGLPDAVIAMDLVISPTNRKLRVATHGNGAYERDLFEYPSTVQQGPPAAPNSFELFQNYPNPFNSQTIIPYRLTASGRVSLAVYNSNGQLIKYLIIDEQKSAGKYETVWDGNNEQGKKASSGTFYYQLSVDNLSSSRGMIFIK